MGFEEAISRFGADVKAKLSNPGASGAPEDQLRGPLETLLKDFADLAGIAGVVPVGESALADLKTRPDYAVTRAGALVGFIEVKAPGKGADPRRFREVHDKEQWDKLKSLPNLLYTDGECFALWRNGAPEGDVVRLEGDLHKAGASLKALPELLALFTAFFQWQPIAPRNAKALAETSARLCRLLRDEVTEQMAQGAPVFADLAADWKKLLFPNATDKEFADGYAQAVTFGLLMARAQKIRLADGLAKVADTLAKSNSLIGTALKVLTDNADNQDALKTSLRTLTRVLDVVNWDQVSKGKPDAWLYFYEDFLEAYDNDLRKKTGSYYTPPPIVTAMVRMTDEVLREKFGVTEGLASPDVTLADPAVGSGTFLLGVLRRIAETIAADQGQGAVPGAMAAALDRLIGFELQFGPFSVAQLRLLAEMAEHLGSAAAPPLKLYVADTLSNPDEEEEHIFSILKPLAASRREANRIKRAEPITVVIGNPPYKEKAKGMGGWVENGSKTTPAPLDAWQPPKAWKAGAHAHNLRNLYVYFWRWATWKVFGDGAPSAAAKRGVICFITVAGFLNGPGFQKMRADLRRDADDIWVIDCSPEGHQPGVATRVFQDVQQPVCIVLAARTGAKDPASTARVLFRALPEGKRDEKFNAISNIAMLDGGWTRCSDDPRAPLLPDSEEYWRGYAPIEALFESDYLGCGPYRTWPIAPDKTSLDHRWKALLAENDRSKKSELMKETRDRTLLKKFDSGVHGHASRTASLLDEKEALIEPVRYAYRSFDRQYIIPDKRVIDFERPQLWEGYSSRQSYMTALTRTAPSAGPALTCSALVPDMDHYKGSFGGRVFPLWANAAATQPNIAPHVIALLATRYGAPVAAVDVFAYIAAVAAHPGYTQRFAKDLVQPGLRIPITAEPALFAEAAKLGREIVWLHTFGERFVSTQENRPASAPRLPPADAPTIPKDGAIPNDSERFPQEMRYDAGARRLRVGEGFIDNVAPEVWAYEVSGKQVLTQWFSYRRRDRSRPLIGSKRPNSPLADIQPDHWLAEYTSELLNVIHVLGRLVRLESAQADLLARICDGPLLSVDSPPLAGSKETPAVDETAAEA